MAQAISRRLIAAMPEGAAEIVIPGKAWQNVNFHLRPGLVAELDWLHLAALGYGGAAGDKLLAQLRAMRSSSSWRFAG